MAVDKLVDSAQLDADLTAVADAIRTKGGTSADLAFPADFVSAVEAIETGGGSFLCETGTFTLTAITKSKILYHDLGVTPNFCFVYPVEVEKNTSDNYQIVDQFIYKGFGQSNYNISSASGTKGDNHLRGQGIGYSNNVWGTYNWDGKTNSNYGGYLGDTYVRVGGVGGSNSDGRLAAGTFGYVLGVLPV